MSLHLATQRLFDQPVRVETDHICVMDDNGNCAFRISIVGNAISIHGVDSRKDGDAIFSNGLIVHPQASNAILVLNTPHRVIKL